MTPKLNRTMKALRRAGMTSSMKAIHIIAARGGKGWHYHVHLLLEFPAGAASPEMLRRIYFQCAKPELCFATPDSSRLVIAAGPAIPECAADDGNLDFWNESESALVRAVQYPIRDLAQGVNAVRLGNDRARVRECVHELLVHGGGWKLRQTSGRWRKYPPAEPERERPPEHEPAESDSGSTPPPSQAVAYGTIISLFKRAVRGDAEARNLFRSFELTARNRSDFARRFVRFCRIASGGAHFQEAASGP